MRQVLPLRRPCAGDDLVLPLQGQEPGRADRVPGAEEVAVAPLQFQQRAGVARFEVTDADEVAG